MRAKAAWFGAFAILAAGCGSDEPTGSVEVASAPGVTPTTQVTTTRGATTVATPPPVAAVCADVVGAEITAVGDTFTVSATVASGDTGWEKYADAWEVRAPIGAVLGTRILAHPHETEQPFTRSLSGVEIPGDVDEVVIAARDSVEGFCGETLSVEVPGR